MNRKQCHICDRLLVPPTGPEDSLILLIGSIPDQIEIMSGQIWNTDAGEAFKSELGRAGINFRDCRVTNLWQHTEINKKDDSFVKEEDFHFGRMMNEVQGKKAVFLTGRQVIKALFVDSTVTDLEGLNVIPAVFPPEVETCIISRNPSIVLTPGGVVGNLRHSIQRFAQLTKEIRL